MLGTRCVNVLRLNSDIIEAFHTAVAFCGKILDKMTAG